MRDLTGWRVGEGAFSLGNKVLYCFACVRTTLDVFRVCVRARVHVRVCVCVSTRICIHVSVCKWSKLLLLLYPISLKLPVCFCLVLFCYYCSSLVTSSRKKIINKPEIQAEREREKILDSSLFSPPAQCECCQAVVAWFSEAAWDLVSATFLLVWTLTSQPFLTGSEPLDDARR